MKFNLGPLKINRINGYFTYYCWPLMKLYFNPNYNNIRIIEENTQYISSLNTTIQEKLIILKAQLGGDRFFKYWLAEIIVRKKWRPRAYIVFIAFDLQKFISDIESEMKSDVEIGIQGPISP